MKNYKFDYIREEVMEKWSPEVRKRCTLSMIEGVGSITMPWFMPGETYIPPQDIYGDIVEDVHDWYAQKTKYCKELYDEVCRRRSWIDNFNVEWDRFVLCMDISFSYGFCVGLTSLWSWLKGKLLMVLLALVLVGCINSQAKQSSGVDLGGTTVVTLYGCEYLCYEFYTSGHWEKLYVHRGNCKYCEEKRVQEIKELLEQLKAL